MTNYEKVVSLGKQLKTEEIRNGITPFAKSIYRESCDLFETLTDKERYDATEEVRQFHVSL